MANFRNAKCQEPLCDSEEIILCTSSHTVYQSPDMLNEQQRKITAQPCLSTQVSLPRPAPDIVVFPSFSLLLSIAVVKSYMANKIKRPFTNLLNSTKSKDPFTNLLNSTNTKTHLTLLTKDRHQISSSTHLQLGKTSIEQKNYGGSQKTWPSGHMQGLCSQAKHFE